MNSEIFFFLNFLQNVFILVSIILSSFSLKALNLSFQTLQGKNGDWPKDNHCRGRCIEETRVLVEGETMLRPVGKVGGGVHGTKPDHQHEEGEGVEDRPEDGHGQHLFVVLLS